MFRRLLEKPIPALILTRSLEPFPELMEMAVKHKRTILRSKEDTSLFIPNSVSYTHLDVYKRQVGGGPEETSWDSGAYYTMNLRKLKKSI